MRDGTSNRSRTPSGFDPFLRAIYDRPWDELPAKVAADWLDENGYPDAAQAWRDGLPLTGYDWRQAFAYAGETGTDDDGLPAAAGRFSTYGQANVQPALPDDDAVNTRAFTRRDVTRIVALDEGENDSASWLLVGELADGRFFALKAWCDYTGWD